MIQHFRPVEKVEVSYFRSQVGVVGFYLPIDFQGFSFSYIEKDALHLDIMKS